tara:strand:+ start:137 stop:907 length:771 start_codon:yes stop_codon:yes gene_type:complete
MGLNNNVLDFHVEVSKGLVPKHSTINKFGYNLDIDTGTDPETVWSAGGLYTFPTSADTLKIVSNDVDDNGTGTTGALTIKVQGLDANYDVIEEDFTLNGQTAVTGDKEFLRVYRAFVTSAGSSEHNEGVITINNSDDSITLAEIPVERSQTQMAVYTVPRGHKAYITNISAAIVKSGANRHASIGVYIRKNGVKKLIQQLAIETSGSTTFNKTYTMPLALEEKTDVYMNCLEVSSSSTAIFANFGLLLVDQSRKYQ